MPKFIVTASDLETSDSAKQQGFLNQALRKAKEAKPYLDKGRSLHAAMVKAKTIADLTSDPMIQESLLTACGFSDKALNYFTPIERGLLAEAISQIAGDAGDNWREELIYRYMLTKGDSLGGSMRNIVGAGASELFTKAVLDGLKAQDTKDFLVNKSTGGKIQGIAWGQRLIVFDKTPTFFKDASSSADKKNIDVILVKTNALYLSDAIFQNHKTWLGSHPSYLACGELKGGIDPAGADEHWKTANSALGRIRARFGTSSSPPKMFFIGAAIEAAMAQEIFRQLQDGNLTHAANLTNAAQVEDLAQWLVSL